MIPKPVVGELEQRGCQMSGKQQYPMTIRPVKRDTKSTKLSKCPECRRMTFRNNRCERCGCTPRGGGTGGSRFLCL